MQELQQVEIGAGTAVRLAQLAAGIQQAQRAYGDAMTQAVSQAGRELNGNPWDLKIDGEKAYLVEMGERPAPARVPDDGGEDGEEASEA